MWRMARIPPVLVQVLLAQTNNRRSPQCNDRHCAQRDFACMGLTKQITAPVARPGLRNGPLMRRRGALLREGHMWNVSRDRRRYDAR